MELQRVLSKVRQAVSDYEMIRSEDFIAVGLSGGKDSLTLLRALCELRKFYPQPFSLCAVTVDLGFGNTDMSAVRAYCQELGVEHHIILTDIASVVFEIKKETNPCALCAKMRKGAFNNKLLELGCSKAAYAHHMDDAVETFMLSLLFEGRISTFSPVTHLDKTGLTLIRPLLYMKEADVKGFVNRYKLPVLKNPCPADGYTKREYVKQVLNQLNQEHPGIRRKIFTAIRGDVLPDWRKIIET